MGAKELLELFSIPVFLRQYEDVENLNHRLKECIMGQMHLIGYLDMLTLNRRARLILTDSGGLQEEATMLRVPCITLRYNTERPVTVAVGANQLAGNQPDRVRAAVGAVLSGNGHPIHAPELWDGKSAIRIVSILSRL